MTSDDGAGPGKQEHTLTTAFYLCGHPHNIPLDQATMRQHCVIEQWGFPCPDCQLNSVYLVARHDGEGGWNDVTPYLGFSWRVLPRVPGLEIPRGLAILQGPREHARWMAGRLASGMLLRHEPSSSSRGPGQGSGEQPYTSPEEADAAVAMNAPWWAPQIQTPPMTTVQKETEETS